VSEFDRLRMEGGMFGIERERRIQAAQSEKVLFCNATDR
jgi:hypothetical protein